jgi:hypothetical protein
VPDDDIGQDASAHTQPTAASLHRTSSFFEALKTDFATIRLILITTLVTCSIMGSLFLWVIHSWFPKLFTFQQVDDLLGVTAHVQPKILTNISEELGSAYSKTFSINPQNLDSSLVFYSEPKQRVFLSLAVTPKPERAIPGVKLQMNGRDFRIDRRDSDYYLISHKDITKRMEDYRLNGALEEDETDSLDNINTLRIVIPQKDRENILEVKVLVLVLQRVHPHVVP